MWAARCSLRQMRHYPLPVVLLCLCALTIVSCGGKEDSQAVQPTTQEVVLIQNGATESFSSINEALTVAQAGAEIKVGTGTFKEAIRLKDGVT